jgi:hypothetical protein
MTQAYGYNEVSNGLKDIKHFGNDYDRNKTGPAHSNSLGGRSNISKIQANDAAGLQISPYCLLLGPSTSSLTKPTIP